MPKETQHSICDYTSINYKGHRRVKETARKFLKTLKVEWILVGTTCVNVNGSFQLRDKYVIKFNAMICVKMLQ